ncbi:MAG TPA: phosphatase PAP2 family protein [Devosiaceae bacterium]|jgi:undecaprenyl-diphosphatase|nr:phosphatase PAP2 family protein [Devosiaceae bacterium]
MIELANPWPFGLNRRTWPLFAGVVIALAVKLLIYDHRLSSMITAKSADVLTFFNWVTRWGEADWILIPSAILLVVSAITAWLVPRRLPKLALIEMIEIYAFIFVGVGLPGLVANLVKRLVGRGRPPVFDQVGTLGFHPMFNDFFFQSFPSGHTTTAFSAAMVLGFLAPRWFWVGLVYACAIGTSRMVLGVHYPTDVLGGMVLGTLGAYAVRNWFADRRWGFERRPDGRIVRRRPVATMRLLRPLQRGRALR